MESIPGADAMKIVEMITKNLENYINLVDKAAAVLERADSKFERNSTVDRCYQTALHATEKLLMNGRVHRCSKLHCCLILRNCHSLPTLQQPPP